jgi:hypothetical protein
MSEDIDNEEACSPCDDCGMHAACCGEPHDVGMCVYLYESDDEETDSEGRAL